MNIKLFKHVVHEQPNVAKRREDGEPLEQGIIVHQREEQVDCGHYEPKIGDGVEVVGVSEQRRVRHD